MDRFCGSDGILCNTVFHQRPYITADVYCSTVPGGNVLLCGSLSEISGKSGYGSSVLFPVCTGVLSFVYLTRECENGIYLVWLILISSWGCDTCAYVVGKLIGKKHIFPELSPHKSLEGCIGGVAGAALIGGLYAHFFVEAAFPDQIITWTIAFICAAGAVMSMVGDLAASAIKRNHNIKDYGKLIPGHGGIMDRFDSMTVTAPMTYFLAILMIGLR